MKKISNLLILAVLAIGMGLTSCEGALDDILGEWSRPSKNPSENPESPAVSLATPLTLEAITDGTITVTNPKPSMKFSLNGGAKSAVTTNPINVAAGDKVQFYGAETQYYNGATGTAFGGTAEVKVYGNIMSLLDETGYETKTDLPNESSVFHSLFYGNAKLTDASGLLLPAMTLANQCYYGMFYGCTSLTTAPELKAETLAPSCYNAMFQGCTSLTVAPELKSETLADNCYSHMFQGCTSLTTAPKLPAMMLTGGCYYAMFDGCTSLTVAPELKAETLANCCYEGMFSGCTALTTAPKLPATTLANYCYYFMFTGCTALTTAPELKAETLAPSCYLSMFEGCTSLTTAYVKAAFTDSNFECSDMFKDCTATGAKLHTTSGNKSSWDSAISSNSWSTWTAVGDWN